MRFNNTVGNVNISLDTSRLDRNFREAQKLLNMQVVADCEPLVPFAQGHLRDVRYPEGIYGKLIEYPGPYANYQYVSKVRTDELGRTFVGRYETKPVLTDKDLKHHTPGTTGHWFEKAKEQNLNQWVDLVQKTVGKE